MYDLDIRRDIISIKLVDRHTLRGLQVYDSYEYADFCPTDVTSFWRKPEMHQAFLE